MAPVGEDGLGRGWGPMNVIFFCGECVVGDFCEEGEVGGHGVVNQFQVVLLGCGQVRGIIEQGKVDVRIGKGRLG